MTKITSFLVKELRKRTSAGVMDCKKALIKANGNIELAIENMRKSGAIKAAKKAANITSNGVVFTKTSSNYGIILEVNCQTDFAAKESSFQAFANKVLETAFTGKISNLEKLKTQFEEERIALITKIGENITIRRVASLQGEIVRAYQHGVRIGVLIAAKGSDEKLVRQLAMHVAARKPEFLEPEDVPVRTVEKEYQVQIELAMKSGKPKEIAKKIVAGQMKKFTNEISLIGQPFIMDPKKSVSDLLKECNIQVTGFICFEVGEKIEKEENC